MKNIKQNNRRGFIQFIVIIVVVIILFAYFKNDIQKFFNTPEIKNALLTAIDWIQQALLWIVGKLGWTSNQLK
jgi:hydrogenase-4 membrane subunit HyfE